ncbi:MAG: thioredoxin domain-containing protein [Pseudomonadota bacterium]
MPIRDFARRAVIIGLSALVLGACGETEDANANVTGTLADKVFGPADAPVEIIEYASITCGACAQYHRDVVPAIKEMADEGRVRFVFREFPTAPVEVAVAGFAAARCTATDEAYFAMLDDMFINQRNIFAATQNGTVRTALQAIAARHGVDSAAFDACLTDETIRSEIQAATTTGQADGVTGTPTLFLNGRLLRTPEGRSVESITELVDSVAPRPEG